VYWALIVTFTKVLRKVKFTPSIIILTPSPICEMVSTGLIFPFSYMTAIFPPHSLSFTLS
jgi:hypothetical protein